MPGLQPSASAHHHEGDLRDRFGSDIWIAKVAVRGPKPSLCKCWREGNIPCGSGQHASLLQSSGDRAAAPASAKGGRYELVPEPDVRQTSTNRVTSAYVIDKKANQFWICTARYNFQDLTANNGDCVKLPSDIGRPSLTEAHDMRPVTGTAAISAYLPVFWFIEPTS